MFSIHKVGLLSYKNFIILSLIQEPSPAQLNNIERSSAGKGHI